MNLSPNHSFTFAGCPIKKISMVNCCIPSTALPKRVNELVLKFTDQNSSLMNLVFSQSLDCFEELSTFERIDQLIIEVYDSNLLPFNLSQLVENGIVGNLVKIRSTPQTFFGIREPPANAPSIFDRLPEELFLKIVNRLEIKYLLQLRLVSWYLEHRTMYAANWLPKAIKKMYLGDRGIDRLTNVILQSPKQIKVMDLQIRPYGSFPKMQKNVLRLLSINAVFPAVEVLLVHQWIFGISAVDSLDLFSRFPNLQIINIKPDAYDPTNSNVPEVEPPQIPLLDFTQCPIQKICCFECTLGRWRLPQRIRKVVVEMVGNNYYGISEQENRLSTVGLTVIPEELKVNIWDWGDTKNYALLAQNLQNPVPRIILPDIKLSWAIRLLLNGGEIYERLVQILATQNSEVDLRQERQLSNPDKKEWVEKFLRDANPDLTIHFPS